MSFEIRSAIDCLKEQIKDGEFNALALIDYLSHEDDIGVSELEQIGVDTDLIKNYLTIYHFKNQLGDAMEAKFRFNGDYLSPRFIKQFTMSDLKDNTSKHNLFSALLEYTKEKVRQLLGDIDNDVLESVLKYIQSEIKKMEKDNE